MGKPFRRDPDRIGDNGLTRLQEAIRTNDLKQAALLIKDGANVNLRGNMVFPPLHYALEKNRTTIAVLLMQSGADVNLQDTNGRTPLHYACENCHEAFIFALLKLDADPNIPDKSGQTPLHVLSTSKPELAGVLVRGGANVNARDENGNTPLHLFLDKPAMVEHLLRSGADPNIKNDIGYSPYMLMLEEDRFREYHKILQNMVAFRADLGSTNQLGETVLHLAARLEMPETFNQVLRTADLTLRDAEGNNVLHALVRTQNVAMIARVLEQNDTLLDQQNNHGKSPLAELCARATIKPHQISDRFMATARFLLARGADPAATDYEGRTLLHHAVEQGRDEFIDTLIRYHAPLDVVDHKGKSALHIAIDKKDIELIDKLLDAGANPDLKDSKGWTILDRLAASGDRDSPVVQRLIVAGGQYNKQLPLNPDMMRPVKNGQGNAMTKDSLRKDVISKDDITAPRHRDDFKP